MYRPRAFADDDPERLRAFVEAHPFAILIGPDEHVTHLPLLAAADAGGVMLGHLAAANPHHAALVPGREVLAIFAGPHGYVSPRWYASAEAVPTWNYSAVHLRLRVLDTPGPASARDEMRAMVRRLDPAEDIETVVTPELIDGMLRGIHRHRFEVLEARGIFKLSQNRSAADIAGVIDALRCSAVGGDRDLAALMQDAAQPRATAGASAAEMHSPVLDPRIEAVVDAWFGPLTGGLCSAERRRAMFKSDPAADRAIAERFGALIDSALAGELDHWAATARGRLALLVLLDQWPRNVFRGTPRAFAGDAAALEFAREGVGRGDDAMLPTEQRAIAYLPFEHSESRADQDTAVVLLERLRNELPAEDPGHAVVQSYLQHAREHRDIIRRFGRFPHRNALLGRTSSAQESSWLEASGRSFGQQPA